MTDQSHTPLPWRVFTNPDGTKLVGVGGQDGEGILDAGFGVWAWSDPEGIANAELVVRSVNSLPSLVKALETVHEFMMEDVKSGDSDLWTVGYSELFDEVDRALSSYRGEGK